MIVNFFFYDRGDYFSTRKQCPTENRVVCFKVYSVNLDVYLNMSLIFATTGYAYYLTLSIGKD